MKVNTGFGMICCRGTWFFKGSRRVKNSACTCQTLKQDGVATWLFQSVSTVFFASLECCSCFHVDTNDGPDGGDSHTSHSQRRKERLC
ncbi:hypothetical protein Fmac_027247 [Flemingia macrophylla]|uniref:Uncharacterized protein n=1 Tax=Flemingia macrophylla TaxID=520843 RepID=A0ABD1LHD5_9FABA